MTLRNSNDREGQEGSSHIRKIKTAASEDNKIQLARMRKEMAEKERQTRLLEAIRLKEERWRNNYNANTNHKTNSNHVLVGGISGRSSIRRDEDERRAAVRERKRQQDEEHRKRMEALKAKQDAKLAMLNQTQSSPKRQSKPSRSLNDANSKPINKQLKEELNKKPTNRPQKPLPARLQQTIDRLAVPKRRNFASLPIRNNLSSQAHSQSMHPLTSNPKSQMTLTTVFHRGTTKRKTSGVVVGNVAMQSKPSPPQPATPRQSGENSPLLTKAQSTYSYSSVTDNDDDDEEQQRRIHQEYQEAEKKRLQEAIAERERIELEELERKRLEDERKAENERLRICAEEERKARLAKDEIEREERRQKLNAILESAQSKLNYMDDDDHHHHHRNHHSSSAASSGIASEDNSFHNNDDDNDASTDSILERIIGNSLKTLGSPTDSIFAIRRVPSPINTTSSSLTSEQPNNSNDAAVNGNNENEERSQSSSPPSTPPVTQTSPSSAIPNSNGGDSLKLLS